MSADIKPLFQFNTILNLDMGIYYTIKNKYHNTEVFRKEILDSDDKNFIELEMHIRDDMNPLSVLLNDKYANEAESLYEDLLKNEYESILNLSIFSSFFKILKINKNIDSAIKPTILCENEYEVKYLKDNKIQEYADIIIVKDYKDLDLSKYDTLYINSIYDLLKYPYFELKNIIIPDHNYNLEKTENEKMPLLSISAGFVPRNKIMIANIMYDMPIEGIDNLTEKQ